MAYQYNRENPYDPSIQGLLAETKSDWGNPIENRENLVPYGIRELDLALYGIDIINGEVNNIMGAQKQRKTTFAINILCNYMTSEKPVNKPFTVVDALESGMHPKRYRDAIISVMASRYLFEKGHRLKQKCPACGTPQCTQLGISPEFLMYNSRTKHQEDAIDYAMWIMSTWPLHIYGANPDQGNTRSLAAAVKSTKTQEARWKRLIKEFNAKIIFIDHVQQYSFETDLTDYEKQLRAVAAISEVVAQEFIAAFVLSQVSLGSLKDARANNGKVNAAGGTKLQQEANTSFRVAYASGSGQMAISIEESRKSPSFTLWQTLEDTSGTFYGSSRIGAEE